MRLSLAVACLITAGACTSDFTVRTGPRPKPTPDAGSVLVTTPDAGMPPPAPPMPVPDAGSSPAPTTTDAGVCAVASARAVPRPVDVIIAVDQSASMGEEIQGVIDNLNTRLAQVLDAAGLDYRVFFLGGQFCIKAPLGKGVGPPECYDSNPPRYYHLNGPVNSSDALTLLLWSYDGNYKQPNTCTRVSAPALKWSDKVRFDSQKVFIAVTDDDPVSFSFTQLGCTSASYCANWQCPTYADRAADWPGGLDFATELYKLQPAGMFGTPSDPKWIFHAIVSVQSQLPPTAPVTPLGSVCAFNGNTGETSGVEYQKLARLTGGTRFPTCNTDYSPVFQKVSAQITTLACELDLAPTGLGTVDTARTNVAIGNTPVPRDESAPCASANGWQFANNFDRVVLCGSACAQAKARPDAGISITVGCSGSLLPDGGSLMPDGGSIVETSPDGGSCRRAGDSCQVGGAACCFGLMCTPHVAGGPTCDSQIN